MRYSVVPIVLLIFSVTFGCRQAAAPDVKAPPTVVASRKNELANPTQIHVLLDGMPVNELMYPFLGDIDGDGKPDLLIGTRLKGRLLIYPDVRSATDHVLAAPQWFDEREPTGRIPAG